VKKLKDYQFYRRSALKENFKMKSAFFPFFLLTLLSCGNENFNKVEQVNLTSSPGGFRFLGVRAQFPELPLTGGTSTLEVYLVDAQNAARTLMGRYEVCLDPGISRGADVSCTGQATTTGTYDIDTNLLASFGDFRYGYSTPLTLTFPDVSAIAAQNSISALNGISYLVIFTVTGSGVTQTAFTRVIATNRTTRNQNPSTSTITVNGGTPALALRENDRLTSSNTSMETYQVYTSSGVLETRTEAYKVAWYTTLGEFDRPKANIGETTLYKGPTNSSPQLLFALTRDERGGLSVVSFQLQN
jgi:hypothetical protein